MQELKSQQEALPLAVAGALRDDVAFLRAAAAHAPGATDDAFQLPGLTITSFHLAQLRRSQQVRNMLLASCPLPRLVSWGGGGGGGCNFACRPCCAYPEVEEC